MKNKNIQNSHSIHQKVERFFRSRGVLLAMLAFMAFAALNADRRIIKLVHAAYAQGFGLVGAYMREETTRMPVNFGAGVRITTISGR
jgi:hypothetical protein